MPTKPNKKGRDRESIWGKKNQNNDSEYDPKT